jgi:hypothetical protein
MESVYSAVRTGSLNKAVCASAVKGESPPIFRKKTANHVKHDIYIASIRNILIRA